MLRFIRSMLSTPDILGDTYFAFILGHLGLPQLFFTGRSPAGLGYVTSIATVVSEIPFKASLSGSWFSLAMLLMALLGVTFGTLSRLVATVASFKADGEGAEVLVPRCTFIGETTLTLLR